MRKSHRLLAAHHQKNGTAMNFGGRITRRGFLEGYMSCRAQYKHSPKWSKPIDHYFDSSTDMYNADDRHGESGLEYDGSGRKRAGKTPGLDGCSDVDRTRMVQSKTRSAATGGVRCAFPAHFTMSSQAGAIKSRRPMVSTIGFPSRTTLTVSLRLVRLPHQRPQLEQQILVRLHIVHRRHAVPALPARPWLLGRHRRRRARSIRRRRRTPARHAAPRS